MGRSITVAPDTGYSKYLSLAQLMDGEEALSLYNKGIQLILKEQQTGISKKEDEAEDETTKSKADKLRKELSNSYCAVAELFMTDLCDADEVKISLATDLPGIALVITFFTKLFTVHRKI